MKKLTIVQQVELFHAKEGCRLKFVSGKWFIFDGLYWEEVKNIKRYLYRYVLSGELQLADGSQMDKFLDLYITVYGNNGPGAWWYDPIVVQKVKKSPDATISDDPAFALEPKQYKLLNAMLFRPQEAHFFITTGVGGSGKSTFGNIVKQLFDNDIGPYSLSDLGDKFKLGEATSHRLIYSEEINASDLDNGVIKTIAAKECINRELKFQNPYPAQSQSVMLFNCNRPPRIDVRDTGILRRIIYYCRDTKIEHPDTSLKAKVYTPEELLTFARIAYHMDMTDWEKDFEEETRRVLASNNNVYLCRAAETYNQYVELAREGGYKPYNRDNWQEVFDLFKEWGLINPKKIEQPITPKFAWKKVTEELPW